MESGAKHEQNVPNDNGYELAPTALPFQRRVQSGVQRPFVRGFPE